MASNQKVIYVYESFRSTTPNFLGTLFVENVRGRESYCLKEPEALYDFITGTLKPIPVSPSENTSQ